MRKLRCFIAMAFGWDDTDAIFEFIRQTFSDTMDVRRVDRINHNKDIDDKIIEELETADLVIADLTYARPSVYFEAGYAQGRPIPVIYTARRDHIGKKATDDSRRVHFDLQMRNIIEWERPTADFKRRLKERIGLVAAPLLRERAEAEARRAEEKVFAGLSQHQQKQSVLESALQYLRTSDFHVMDAESADAGGRHPPQTGRRWATSLNERTLHIVSLWAMPSLNRKDISWHHERDSWIERSANLNVNGVMPSHIVRTRVIISLSKVRLQMLRDAWPRATCDGLTLTLMTPEYLPARKFWLAGERIENDWEWKRYKVGDRNFETTAEGTFETVGRWPERKKKVGSSCAFKATFRFAVIDAIRRPGEVESAMEELFRQRSTLAS
jgi:hypothetical protein